MTPKDYVYLGFIIVGAMLWLFSVEYRFDRHKEEIERLKEDRRP